MRPTGKWAFSGHAVPGVKVPHRRRYTVEDPLPHVAMLSSIMTE